MNEIKIFSAEEALARLKEGNKKYLTANTGLGNISKEIRTKTAKEGQKPYAIIITCSDSRVIPENIFSAGIGELFVIRSAGFTIDKNALGSVEYAVEHLGMPLIVVMGHTHCGAVTAALEQHEQHEQKNLQSIIDEISIAIGNEKNLDTAIKLNVKHSSDVIKNSKIFARVVEAIYDIDSGEVEFLN